MGLHADEMSGMTSGMSRGQAIESLTSGCRPISFKPSSVAPRLRCNASGAPVSVVKFCMIPVRLLSRSNLDIKSVARVIYY